MFGLALQGLVEQFTAEGIRELHHQFFQISKGGSPRRPLRPVEVMQQVFGRGLQDGTQVSRNLYLGGCLCHVELLS